MHYGQSQLLYHTTLRQGEPIMQIIVLKLSENEKKNLGITKWPVTTIDTSIFAWHHDQTEECYLLEGEAVATTSDGKKTNFGAGDYVIFPKGLSCICHITKPVRKHSKP
jgi:uncharacterized protein